METVTRIPARHLRDAEHGRAPAATVEQDPPAEHRVRRSHIPVEELRAHERSQTEGPGAWSFEDHRAASEITIEQGSRSRQGIVAFTLREQVPLFPERNAPGQVRRVEWSPVICGCHLQPLRAARAAGRSYLDPFHVAGRIVTSVSAVVAVTTPRDTHKRHEWLSSTAACAPIRRFVGRRIQPEAFP
jgi:hypothetical protein